jgi:uncharacterized protein (DUF2345 family)
MPGWFTHLSIFQLIIYLSIYLSRFSKLVAPHLTSHLTRPTQQQIPITLQTTTKTKTNTKIRIQIPKTTNPHLPPQAQKRVVPLASNHNTHVTHRHLKLTAPATCQICALQNVSRRTAFWKAGAEAQGV